MGIIKRQGFYYTLISFTGVAIGTINTLFLYVQVFRPGQVGELNNLLSVGLMFTQLAQIGLPSIVSKFFPKFRSEDKEHGGMIAWVVTMASISFLTIALIYLSLQTPIIAYYGKSPYFRNIYFLVIPYSFFLLMNAILDILCRVLYKGLLFSFMNEIVVRLGTGVGLILYYFKVLDFYHFLILFITLNGSISLALLIQLMILKEFKLKFNRDFFIKQTKTLLQYGFYTFLAGSTFILIQKADVIILTHYEGDEVQGIYFIFLNIITIMRVPSVAIGRVSYQLVADFWENKNLPQIEEIYKKTSLVQMIIGAFFFIGIALNRDFLIFVLRKWPSLADHFNLFYVLGLAVLVDTTGGLNTFILSVSHKFRISTGILVVSVIICILSNNLLTPHFGAIGAAFSLLITYFFLNFCCTLYLQIRFKIQPFSLSHLAVLGIGLFTFFAINYIPLTHNHFLDLIIRGSLATLIYIGLILYFKVSEDIDMQYRNLVNRFIK